MHEAKTAMTQLLLRTSSGNPQPLSPCAGGSLPETPALWLTFQIKNTARAMGLSFRAGLLLEEDYFLDYTVIFQTNNSLESHLLILIIYWYHKYQSLTSSMYTELLLTHHP